MTRRLAVLFALAVALAAACAITWSIVRTRAIDQLHEAAAARAGRTTATLQAALERYESLPYLVSTHPLVQDALAAPGDAAAAQANHYLEDVTRRAQAAVTYIITTDGLCIASSNWREPGSFTGTHYNFRPYFVDAIAGRTGHFFGIGTRSHEPGYYISQPVRRDGKQVGVVVVKIDLSWFPSGDASEPLVVTDEHGVIFLSSVPAWKYHAVRPLSANEQRAIRDTQQYAEEPLTPLPLVPVRSLGPGTQLVRLGRGHLAPLFVQTTRQLNEPGWQLMTLSPLDDVDARARAAAMAVGFAFVAAALLAFYWRLRRARVREMEHGRALLQKAYAELNQRVAERTADLSTANARLTSEVAERTRAEAELRAAQDELVQASKLAALGQMAAGITHELNQPLAALRTFSDNTRVLLERGELAAARDNLEAIGALTERMGRITNQLKLFVGRRRPRNARTPVAPALRNALAMLRGKLAGIALEVVRIAPDGAREPFDLGTEDTSLAVRCDDLRVEQVLINLVSNAIDAVAHTSAPRIVIEIDAQPDAIAIAICDNGPGVAPDVLPRLFEPFFTTTEMGQGLGLGLAISSSIARDAGGTLTARAASGVIAGNGPTGVTGMSGAPDAAHADARPDALPGASDIGTRAAPLPGACFVLTLPRAYALADSSVCG